MATTTSYTLKAFATHANFIDNTPGDATSAIGELSDYSHSFSKTKGYYYNSSYPNVTLISFLSALGTTEQALDGDLKDHIMSIIEWIYEKTINTGGVITASDFLTSILAQFQDTDTTFSCGSIVNNGTLYIPSWVSWVNTSYNGGANTIKIWFSDATFQTTYDEYSITVIPPITTSLDTLIGSYSNAKTILNAISYSDLVAAAQTARNGFPETSYQLLEYDWTDPTNTDNTVAVYFGVLVYGPAGNNVDSINDAIQTYILANSSNTRATWTTYFPDVFKRTEFILIPDWTSYAIANLDTQVGIYSSIQNLATLTTLLNTVAVDYGTTQVATYGNVMAHPYKCMQIAVIGSPNNKSSKYQLSDFYPDYLPVSSTSTDYSRMSAATQKWADMIATMLIGAEALTATSDVPTGYSKVTRNGYLFLVGASDNVHFLIAAKSNFS